MKRTVILFGLMAFLSGCDNDTSLPPYEATIFLEDFEEVENGETLALAGWTNHTAWQGEVYNSNGYAAIENTGEGAITAWLVSPAIELGQNQRKLSFLSAQHHLTPGSNLEVYISSNFNGNPEEAVWLPLEAIIADVDTQWYSFISSGEVDLTNYTGTVYMAFKAVIENEGAYFIDNVKIY